VLGERGVELESAVDTVLGREALGDDAGVGCSGCRGLLGEELADAWEAVGVWGEPAFFQKGDDQRLGEFAGRSVGPDDEGGGEACVPQFQPEAWR
jgi:hypothetical protein